MGFTIQQVIDTILQRVPGAPIDGTVDTVKCGDASQPVKGIVTTFMTTRNVIDQAIALDANMIITHEPTFFNHRDEVTLDWLQGNEVYRAKREVLDRHQIVVWRFHDHWHMHRPDGITTGFLKLMGWEGYKDTQEDYIVNLPPTPIKELIAQIKATLRMPTVRVVGQPEMTCRRVGLVLGAMPGDGQIKAYEQGRVDTLICGETTEWQTCEYVRDSAATPNHKALIVLGHEKSEEAGMRYLVDWLRPMIPGVPITHVPAGDPLRFV
jgi:putative NIF3 family GTP cyclohydrolase 1 type 2